MSEIPASEELLEVIFAALDHAVESVKDGDALIPFALAERAEGRTLTRFAAETLEEGQEQARAHAASGDADRVAIAYDGYLTVEGERSDAVFVEAQERGAQGSVIFAQRYHPGGRFRKFSTVGNAAFAGTAEGFF